MARVRSTPSVARRSPTGGYRAWEQNEVAPRRRSTATVEGDPPLNEPGLHEGMTQREWTEWKEMAARERLQCAAVGLST